MYVYVHMLKCFLMFVEELEQEFGYHSLKLCFCFVKQMDELQVIVGFVQAAKRLKTVWK